MDFGSSQRNPGQGNIEAQRTAQVGTYTDEVHAAVMRVRRALDDGTGGVIGQCEWRKDNPRDNVETVFKTWLEPMR